MFAEHVHKFVQQFKTNFKGKLSTTNFKMVSGHTSGEHKGVVSNTPSGISTSAISSSLYLRPVHMQMSPVFHLLVTEATEKLL